MKYEFISQSEEQTEQLGKKIILAYKSLAKKTGSFIGLMGPLGSGKTTFSRGILKGLGWEKEVVSPTFLIAKYYFEQRTIHIDGYRVLDPLFEYLNLEIDKYISEGYNVIWEWSEPLKKFVKDALWVNLDYSNQGRKMYLTSENYLWQEAIKIVQNTLV